MKRELALLGALSVVALALINGARGTPSAESPHAYMDDESRCAGCHHVEKDEEDYVLNPHIFRISVNDICRTW